jgi:hypothetical protein
VTRGEHRLEEEADTTHVGMDFGLKAALKERNPFLNPGSMLADDLTAANRFNLASAGILRGRAGGPVTGRAHICF